MNRPRKWSFVYGRPRQVADGIDPYRLSDGTRVTLRPLTAQDKAALAQGFAELSTEARYARFFSVRKDLTEEELRYLTELDGVRHYALAAVRHDEQGHEVPLGVARFVREESSSEVAEAAVTVKDAAQNNGLGKLLLWKLSEEAYARGVRRFRCTVLSTNVAVHKMVRHLGSAARVLRRSGEVVELEFDLPAPERPSRAQQTDALQKLLRRLVHMYDVARTWRAR